MANITARDVAALRARTGAGMVDCKNAIEETNGVTEKAAALLRQRGIAKGEKRAGRGTSAGVIASYVHFTRKVAVLLEVNCERAFLARTEEFQSMVKDIALHVAWANPLAVAAANMPAGQALLEQPFVKDEKMKVGDLVKALAGKTGENIVVRRFVRWELGAE